MVGFCDEEDEGLCGLGLAVGSLGSGTTVCSFEMGIAAGSFLVEVWDLDWLGGGGIGKSQLRTNPRKRGWN